MSIAGELRIVPANESGCDDLQIIFGGRGPGHRCQCQRYRLAPGESFANLPLEERTDRLRDQTDCGSPGADRSSGLVAYLDGEPVGWCAVAPRPSYPGLVRVYRVPWEGRDEDRTDAGVWALTCLFTRAGFRKRGISKALAVAAVGFARDRGASALEGYPMVHSAAISEELHVGTVATFTAAGFTEISRPSPRRAVMRRAL